MKKLSTLLAILVIMGMILTACSTASTATTAPEADQSNQAPAQPEATEANQEPAASSETVTLEYWQVDFEGWDVAIEEVIRLFEEQNPGIKVNYTSVSYDEINEKIAAMVPVGQGPDIVNPFYGWVPLWAKSGFLAPLPEDMFPKEEMEEIYLPAIDAMYYDGKLWGVPMNQSNWAILYNVDYFNEVGITELPETWEELREAAIKCTQRDADGNLTRAGYFVSFGTQEHILWKVLSVKNGQPIFSEDQKTVTWNDSSIGEEAFAFVANMIKEDKIMDIGFGDDSPGTAFYTGKTCMRLGSPGNLPVIRSNAPDLNFDSFPLPKGTASDEATALQNQTQYWSYNMTAKAAADPAIYEAALKFMKFLTTEEASMAYIKIAGGLPVLKSTVDDPFFTEDPQLKAFMDTLEYSVPLFWVDEKGERDTVLNMADKVLLNNEDITEVFKWGTEQEQAIRDEFFSE